jgi:predicted TIM-barrel fold metal-dependent hydrolase
MITEIKDKIHVLIQYLMDHQNELVIDADTHITQILTLTGSAKAQFESNADYYHGRPISAEHLLSEMNLAGVDMSLIWQNPAVLTYDDDLDSNFEKLLTANRYILDSFLKYPTKFIPAGWTDPKALGMENAIKLIRILMEDYGFFIIKMNPAQNAYRMYSKDVIQCMDEIVNIGGVAAFHYGADTVYTPPEDLEALAALYPDIPLLAVHMGGGGAGYVEAEETYLKTRAFGLRMPNIKFILSARRDTHTESDLITYQLAGAPYNNNIFCASDAPYGRQSWNFGGYAKMFDSLMRGAEHTDQRLHKNPKLFQQHDVNNYLGGNFASLVIEGYKRFMEKRELVV